MDNTEFEKLDAPGKRLAIAEDVLKQLAAERFVAKRSEYVSIENAFGNIATLDLPQDRTCSLNSVLDGQKCRACAIGSAVLAIADLTRVEVGDVVSDSFSFFSFTTETAAKLLEKYFSQEQLALMEMAFEADLIFYDAHVFDEEDSYEYTPWEGDEILDAISYDVRQAAYGFTHTGRDGTATLDDRAALEKIWRNVLRNGGTFDPLSEPTS